MGPRLRGDDKRLTWLALEPLTGRTHQLRVHCAEMGWPILGDNIYGRAPRMGGPPLHLHSREIVVPISKNKPPVKITAPVPAHMQGSADGVRVDGRDKLRSFPRKRESRTASADSLNAALGPRFRGNGRNQ